MENWLFWLFLIVGGLAVAFAGKRLIKFAVAFAGFLLFYNIMDFFFPGEGGWVRMLVSLAGGAVGAWLATKFFRGFMYFLGFIFVGNAAWMLASFFGVSSNWVEVLVYAVGGLIGLGLVKFMLNTAIVVITALGGAAAASYGLENLLNIQTGAIWAGIFLIVAVAGAIVQWTALKDNRR